MRRTRIRIDQALRDKIRSQAPDGWLPAGQAAKALGLSRTTVFQKVRDGQLPAIHVNNGQRRSLRIQVKPEAAGLFDTPKLKERVVSNGPGELPRTPGLAHPHRRDAGTRTTGRASLRKYGVPRRGAFRPRRIH